LLAEALGRRHHAQHLHDPPDAVEASEVSADGREQDEADLSRDLVGLLGREVLADLSGDGGLAIAQGPWPDTNSRLPACTAPT